MVIVYLEFKLHDYDADFEFKTHLQPSTCTYVGVPHWSVCRHEEFWSLHVQNSPCQKLRFHKSFVHSIQSNIRNDIMSSKHISNRLHGLALVCHVGQFVVSKNSEAYMCKIVLVKRCDSKKLFVHSIQSNVRNDIVSSKHICNHVNGLTLLLQVGQFVVSKNSEAYIC